MKTFDYSSLSKTLQGTRKVAALNPDIENAVVRSMTRPDEHTGDCYNTGVRKKKHGGVNPLSDFIKQVRTSWFGGSKQVYVIPTTDISLTTRLLFKVIDELDAKPEIRFGGVRRATSLVSQVETDTSSLEHVCTDLSNRECDWAIAVYDGPLEDQMLQSDLRKVVADASQEWGGESQRRRGPLVILLNETYVPESISTHPPIGVAIDTQLVSALDKDPRGTLVMGILKDTARKWGVTVGTLFTESLTSDQIYGEIQHLTQLLSTGSIENAGHILERAVGAASVQGPDGKYHIDKQLLEEKLSHSWMENLSRSAPGLSAGSREEWGNLIPTPTTEAMAKKMSSLAKRHPVTGKSTFDDVESALEDEHNPNWAQQLAASKGTVTLVHGPPASSKSVSAEALPSLLEEWTGQHYNLVNFDFAQVFDQYVGNSEHKLAQTLRYLKSLPNSVILWDEAIKSFVGAVSGGHSGDSGITQRLIGMLLNPLNKEIPIALARNHSVLILTSNEGELRQLALSASQQHAGLISRLSSVRAEIMDSPEFFKQYLVNSKRLIDYNAERGGCTVPDIAEKFEQLGYFDQWAQALANQVKLWARLRLAFSILLRETRDQNYARNEEYGVFNHRVLNRMLLETLVKDATENCTNVDQAGQAVLRDMPTMGFNPSGLAEVSATNPRPENMLRQLQSNPKLGHLVTDDALDKEDQFNRTGAISFDDDVDESGKVEQLEEQAQSQLQQLGPQVTR